MKYKVGDKVRVRIDLTPHKVYGSLTFLDGNMSKCAGQICTIMEVLSSGNYYVSENPFAWSEEMLEPADSKTLRMADGTVIGEFGTGGFVCMADGTTIGDFSTGGLCNVFRCGKIPEYVLNEKQAKEYADSVMAIAKSISDITGISYKNSINKLKTCLSAFSNNGISAKNGGKNSMKFTFYVTEGTRVDKSCNGTIPTMITTVEANGYSRTASVGTATCDKADYDMRRGVLEALANMYCDGDFDKVFNKAVKRNELADKKKRTCKYCGKVFDTVEEREAEEAWHVERKKARRERYLLRKRAKEIAFEEQAQKMAKKMIEEDK